MLGSRAIYDPSSSPNALPRALPSPRSRSRSITISGRPITRIPDTHTDVKVNGNENSKTSHYGPGGVQHVSAAPLDNGHDTLTHGDVNKVKWHVPNERSPLLANGADERPSITATNDCRDDTDWKKELRVLISYSLPVLGAQALEYSLSVASLVSIGHISTEALAAATLSSMTAGVTGLSIVMGFSTSLDTMLPPAWTSGTPSLVGLWSLRMMVLMAILMIPILLIWVNAEQLLLFLRQEPEIAKLAGLYLKWFSFGLPAYACNSVLRRFFQSQGLFGAPTRILFIVAPINVALNYLLVWGPDWARLGFIGAPIATAISFNLVTICYIVYGVWFAPRTAWHPLNRECFQNLGFLTKLSCAGVVHTAADYWSWEGVALAASQIGPIALAIQSVVLVSSMTVFQIPWALSNATAVRIGNMLGAQNPRGAALAVRVSVCMCITIAVTVGALLFLFREQWPLLLNKDPSVVKGVVAIVPLVAMFQIFDGLAVVSEGILRSKGQQNLGALLVIIGYYFLGIPLGVFFAFKLGLGVLGLWIGLTIALIFCGLSGLYICTIGTDWREEVNKANERLAQDNDFLTSDLSDDASGHTEI